MVSAPEFLRRRPDRPKAGPGTRIAPVAATLGTPGSGSPSRTPVLAAMAVSTALFAPAALADNSDDTLICQLLLLGQRPGQIAETLHDGHRRSPDSKRSTGCGRYYPTAPTTSPTATAAPWGNLRGRFMSGQPCCPVGPASRVYGATLICRRRPAPPGRPRLRQEEQTGLVFMVLPVSLDNARPTPDAG